MEPRRLVAGRIPDGGATHLAKQKEMMYKATYESIVAGGSATSGSDPRNEDVLVQAQLLGRPNLKLVMLEFDGEVIWRLGNWTMMDYRP